MSSCFASGAAEMFLLWSLILLGAAAGVVLLALRERDVATVEARDETVRRLYEDRLEELRGELAGGVAELEDQEVLEAELGAALLADYEGDQEEVAAEPKKGGSWLGLAGVSAALLVLFTVGVYQTVGDPAADGVAGAEALLGLDPASDSEGLDEWRQRLEERVDARPDDARSWFLLGHANLRLARFAAAAEAFATAHELHGDDPSIDLFWLQARYLAARGQLDATSRSIAERVLASNPNQPLVLEMLAVAAFQEEAFGEAVTLLNRALSGDLAATQRASLQAGFEAARAQLGAMPGSIDVAVAAGETPPHSMTLFVIARPVGGGMPYAVVRRPAHLVPGTIRLDDAVSMNPALPLSSASEVEIVVRLSQAGTAMAHPGDWEWVSEPITLAEVAAAPRLLEATLMPPMETSLGPTKPPPPGS
ncbi:MAG: c-type cytochrome biogenesis protein CcmI [Pseudomonadota bacterium]